MTIDTLLTAAAASALVIAMGCARPEQVDGKAASAFADSAARSAGAPAAVPREATAGARSGPASPSLVPGTPSGGLAQWIGEVRTGLAGVAEQVKRDPAAAKNQALQLYVTRQEYIEIYYGTAGRAVRDAVLAAAVTAAEARFHELLKVLNPPDGRVVATALPEVARALNEQYDVVLRRARELGVDVARLQLASGGES